MGREDDDGGKGRGRSVKRRGRRKAGEVGRRQARRARCRAAPCAVACTRALRAARGRSRARGPVGHTDVTKGLSAPERTALKLCLPLYFAGGLIACLVHATPRRTTYYGTDNQRHSMWEDLIISYSGNLISYGGLMLDAFLLPQIILNIFGSSKEKVLTPFFYVGTTVLRALPHLYDAYRAHRHLPQLSSSYVYARPDEDFYSSAWDIIIPCGGLLFAVLIFLQQRYGGGCILPARFGKPDHWYQAVSMAGI